MFVYVWLLHFHKAELNPEAVIWWCLSGCREWSVCVCVTFHFTELRLPAGKWPRERRSGSLSTHTHTHAHSGAVVKESCSALFLSTTLTVLLWLSRSPLMKVSENCSSVFPTIYTERVTQYTLLLCRVELIIASLWDMCVFDIHTPPCQLDVPVCVDRHPGRVWRWSH